MGDEVSIVNGQMEMVYFQGLGEGGVSLTCVVNRKIINVGLVTI